MTQNTLFLLPPLLPKNQESNYIGLPIRSKKHMMEAASLCSVCVCEVFNEAALQVRNPRKYLQF